MEDFRVIDDTLTDVECMLYDNIYATKDTSEDEDWSKRLEKVLYEIKYLKEEMIFTFKIED